MPRRIVISHFFNEAYLLPWWLEHHRKIFDHGVLIDWHSTDGSADICRQLVPGWELVRSQHERFAAILCDFEVMQHEARFPAAWKIALNTTEFLVAPGLAMMEAAIEQHQMTAIRFPGAIMVDTSPEISPRAELPLTEQKQCGIWEDAFDFKAYAIPGLTFPTRSRIHHRYVVGAYAPGRHASHLPGQCASKRDLGAIWWYGFSPWTAAFKARKLQIATRRADFDKKHGFGVQHDGSMAELERRWQKLRAASAPLLNADGVGAAAATTVAQVA
jgi:Glycosyl transferase family 2